MPSRIDAVGLLTGLVAHASPPGEELAAVEFLVDQMRAAGLEAAIDAAGNAVGQVGAGPRQVLLLGHIDTVPGTIPLRREGDLLYGRGAVDAKGPLAAFVAAAAQGPLPGLQITVIGAVGEEAHSPGATHLRDHYPRPDFLVIGEPSRWNRVTLGYKGSAQFELDVECPTAHSAANDASACEIAVAAWQQLRARCEQYNDGQPGVFNQLTPRLREMHSHTNGLAERARLRIGFRLPPDLSPDALRAMVVETIGPDVQASALPGAVPAFRAEKNTPLVRAALAAIRAEGGQPGFLVKSGTSDMNLVAPAWNCPAIAYGPGDSGLDHTPHEHVSLAEYLRSVRVLRGMLERLARKNAEATPI